jgi:hypothetical protein
MHNYTRLQPIKKHRFANLRFFLPGAKPRFFRSFLNAHNFRPDAPAKWIESYWNPLHPQSIIRPSTVSPASSRERAHNTYNLPSIILPREAVQTARLHALSCTIPRQCLCRNWNRWNRHREIWRHTLTDNLSNDCCFQRPPKIRSVEVSLTRVYQPLGDYNLSKPYTKISFVRHTQHSAYRQVVTVRLSHATHKHTAYTKCSLSVQAGGSLHTEPPPPPTLRHSPLTLRSV